MEPDIKIREVGKFIYVCGLTDNGWRFVDNHVSTYPGIRYGNNFVIDANNLEPILEALCDKGVEFDYDLVE